MTTSFATRRIYTRSHGLRDTFGDFVCVHCHNFVSTQAALAGVHNRNHCPYCLSSRHLDLYTAGDRLAACKARMKPIGLTLKRQNKKYARFEQGELMLVHRCEDCGKIAINRIAADDDNEAIVAIYQSSIQLDGRIQRLLAEDGIALLDATDEQIVQWRLFGQN
jgi:DNA-directed RNA polymerase subunit RPC12/RpoP